MRSERSAARGPRASLPVWMRERGPFPLTRRAGLPRGRLRVERRVEFGNGYAAFFAGQRTALEAGLRLLVHPRLPCEQRQVALKNKSSHRRAGRPACSFISSPVWPARRMRRRIPPFPACFSPSAGIAASTAAVHHPACSGEGESAPVCLAAGLLDRGGPLATKPARERAADPSAGVGIALPLGDAIRRPFLDEGGRRRPTAVAAHAADAWSCRPAAQRTRHPCCWQPLPTETRGRHPDHRGRAGKEGPLDRPGKAAPSPFGGVEAQLAAQILPDLFYPPRMSREWAAAARDNQRRRAVRACGRWAFRATIPCSCMEIHNAADASRAEPYMRLHRSLQHGRCSSPSWPWLTGRSPDPIDAPRAGCACGQRPGIRPAATSMLGVRGGIHPVNLAIHGEEALTAAHRRLPLTTGPGICKRAAPPPADYQSAADPSLQRRRRSLAEAESRSAVLVRGGLLRPQDGSFTGAADALPACPGATCLANPAFGTLVSDAGAGLHLGSECPGKQADSLAQRHCLATTAGSCCCCGPAGHSDRDLVPAGSPGRRFRPGYARCDGGRRSSRTRVTVRACRKKVCGKAGGNWS